MPHAFQVNALIFRDIGIAASIKPAKIANIPVNQGAKMV